VVANPVYFPPAGPEFLQGDIFVAAPSVLVRERPYEPEGCSSQAIVRLGESIARTAGRRPAASSGPWLSKARTSLVRGYLEIGNAAFARLRD